MPRGRPKTVVAPCQYCKKQFKRQEHLLRHERTHTHEKPFACHCGQSFARQDLLARHTKLSHYSRSDVPPPQPEVLQVPPICEATDAVISDSDFVWDPNFMMQDLLPTGLFDADFSFIETPPNIQSTQTSSFSQFSSRLPFLSDADDDLETSDQEERINTVTTSPWDITESDYERISLVVQAYSAILPPQCSLPSRNGLIRYLEKYLRCVQEFLPIFHPATFSIGKKDVELLLAMAALGSLYSYERPKSYELYFMSKAILMERRRCEALQLTSDLLFEQNNASSSRINDLSRIQLYVLLISFASWADKNVVPDALSMASDLALLTKGIGISESDEFRQDDDWMFWITAEERRRTLCAAYVILNMHSIAYGIPPLILNHEVGLFLPSHSETWKSVNTVQWRQVNRQAKCKFQEGLRSCLNGSGITKDASVSSFSNYLLIHGILQQIYLDRHGSSGLQGINIKSFERALRNWQLSWEQADESTLDPLSPKGPFGLTATALLRLAYMRLSLDLDPRQGLLSGDLRCLADRRSTLSRSPHVDKAVLHAAHALSVPVSLGVKFMASTKTTIWTVEHSLCSLECAILLKDWLEMISTTIQTSGIEVLRKAEQKLLEIITGTIKETSFAATLDFLEQRAAQIHRMATTVTKIWAQIFEGIHILEIDNVIRAGLQLLADSSPN